MKQKYQPVYRKEIDGQFNQGRYWTVGDMAYLRDKIKEGKSIKEIARELERSPSACKARLSTVQIGIMLTEGYSSDTLVSWKKRNATQGKPNREREDNPRYTPIKGKSQIKIKTHQVS